MNCSKIQGPAHAKSQWCCKMRSRGEGDADLYYCTIRIFLHLCTCKDALPGSNPYEVIITLWKLKLLSYNTWQHENQGLGTLHLRFQGYQGCSSYAVSSNKCTPTQSCLSAKQKPPQVLQESPEWQQAISQSAQISGIRVMLYSSIHPASGVHGRQMQEEENYM